MENITITAAIIVKNEERCISRCINSVMNFVDEIIIIDTGSEDKTIDIINDLQSKKTKLYSVMWRHSFSAARNAAIDKSTCDYIFLSMLTNIFRSLKIVFIASSHLAELPARKIISCSAPGYPITTET